MKIYKILTMPNFNYVVEVKIYKLGAKNFVKNVIKMEFVKVDIYKCTQKKK